MRMSAQAARTQPKNPMSAASKISRIVTDLFLPIADGYVPAYTPLTPQPDAEELLLLERIWDLFPNAMGSRTEFVDCMCQLYDSRSQGGKRARTLAPRPQQCANRASPPETAGVTASQRADQEREPAVRGAEIGGVGVVPGAVGADVVDEEVAQ